MGYKQFWCALVSTSQGPGNASYKPEILWIQKDPFFESLIYASIIGRSSILVMSFTICALRWFFAETDELV